MLDASLCNVVGSPMSPPDRQWADLHPAMQGSVNSRPQPKPATADVQPAASPADEAITRANQALSNRVCLIIKRTCGTLRQRARVMILCWQGLKVCLSRHVGKCYGECSHWPMYMFWKLSSSAGLTPHTPQSACMRVFADAG